MTMQYSWKQIVIPSVLKILLYLQKRKREYHVHDIEAETFMTEYPVPSFFIPLILQPLIDNGTVLTRDQRVSYCNGLESTQTYYHINCRSFVN